MPILVGGLSRWYFPFPNRESDPGVANATVALVHLIGTYLLQRESHWAKLSEEQAAYVGKDPSITVDIYLSDSMFSMGKGYIEKKIQGVVEEVQKNHKVPRSRCEKDQWRLHRMVDAPRCEACDWSNELVLVSTSLEGSFISLELTLGSLAASSFMAESPRGWWIGQGMQRRRRGGHTVLHVSSRGASLGGERRG
jgi:hypothetical protein